MDICVFFLQKNLKLCKTIQFLTDILTIFQGNVAFFQALCIGLLLHRPVILLLIHTTIHDTPPICNRYTHTQIFLLDINTMQSKSMQTGACIPCKLFISFYTPDISHTLVAGVRVHTFWKQNIAIVKR